MLIEVLRRSSDPAKVQGDALEEFISKWMKIRGYEVVRNLRSVGCEIDLLCKDMLANKRLYVECKAYNDKTISALQLRSFVGAVDIDGYDEGWFVTTGALGKDAKGVIEKWESRTDRQRMQVFTPERLLENLEKTGLICHAPSEIVAGKLSEEESLGEWTLLISELGVHWANTVLREGIPIGYVVCRAEQGRCDIVREKEFFARLADLNFSLSKKGLSCWTDRERRDEVASPNAAIAPVIEVEFGDNWSDYRPSRPEHFVGRKPDLRNVFRFITKVRQGKTEDRIFAIKGDSGIGKSSFVAKIRAEAQQSRKPGGIFVFAVDVRAANDMTYVGQSLVKCLKEAQRLGYGCSEKIEMSNSRDPLSSESIKYFLEQCRRKKQVIVLIFDQFEELYSKIGLSELFEEARKLFFSTISARTNFVLGFAWKSDCSIPQDHPAYYLWQSLSDHRIEFTLRPFSRDDVLASISLFEREFGEDLRPDLKNYFLDNCQGLPWLLKKLCLHLKNAKDQGKSQIEMEKGGLDIGSLFDQELSTLTPEEDNCLRLVAANAPMDWFEATRNITSDVITSLQDKRLLLRKGSKLNLYWDIFREYVLHKTLPEIPLNYFPQSASVDAFLQVALALDVEHPMAAEQIADQIGFSKKTIGNILADMVRFGVARNIGGLYVAENDWSNKNQAPLFRHLRDVFKRHRVVVTLREGYSQHVLTKTQFAEVVGSCMIASVYDKKTLAVYANRMYCWLLRLGYLRLGDSEIKYEDQGSVVMEIPPRHYKNCGKVFSGGASPSLAFKALNAVCRNYPYDSKAKKTPGLRNALALLVRLQLIEQKANGLYVPICECKTDMEILECLFTRCEKEQSVLIAMEILTKNPNASQIEIGRAVGEKVKRKWVESSALRIGGALRIWAKWILASHNAKAILPPPGRRPCREKDSRQMMLNF